MGIISNASEAVKGLYSVFCSASQISCLWTHHLWAPRAFSSKVTWAGLSDRRHVSKDKPNLHSTGRNTEEHWILQCAWPVSLCVCLCTKKDTATALAFNTQLLAISHPAHTIQTYCIDFIGEPSGCPWDYARSLTSKSLSKLSPEQGGLPVMSLG